MVFLLSVYVSLDAHTLVLNNCVTMLTLEVSSRKISQSSNVSLCMDLQRNAAFTFNLFLHVCVCFHWLGD